MSFYVNDFDPTLVRHPAFHHQQGPQVARGALIWSPGAIGKQEQPRAGKDGMPHFLDWLYGNGWDVFYIERDRTSSEKYRERYALSIRNAERALRAKGYQRVVLAGQSSGGAYSLLAASEEFGAEVDGLMIFASGPTLRPHEFYDLLKGACAKQFVVFHAARDESIGQRSKAEVEQTLNAKNVPCLNIFEPDGLSGHGAAFQSKFSKMYGDQILQFLN
jgi:predicted esterase